jgi:hypothetical protein
MIEVDTHGLSLGQSAQYYFCAETADVA